jgi:hypothetical protein
MVLHGGLIHALLQGGLHALLQGGQGPGIHLSQGQSSAITLSMLSMSINLPAVPDFLFTYKNPSHLNINFAFENEIVKEKI